MSFFDREHRPLSVLLDIRQPQAYLALHPVVAMANQCTLHLDLLPHVVPALNAPSEPAPDDDRGVRHRRNRAHAIAREIDTYAAAQELVIQEYYRDPDPSALNLAWLWVRQEREERLLPFLTEAFRAYWALELDLSSTEAIASLLESLDAGAPEFRSWCTAEGPGVAEELADALRERGLSRSPSYVLEDEVFIGRQHLPMLRWIVEGRVGRGPI